jgi:N-acetylglutamate synthase-like GNAT family acetyltransferase
MIREMRFCDIPACRKIVEENWNATVADRAVIEMKHAFERTMEWPPIYYVYEIEEQVVGFAGMIQGWIMHDVWDFIWINVQKDHQKTNIGKQLTEYRINKVKELGGKEIHLMTRNYQFFKKLGFRTVSVNNDWVLMVLELGELSL